MSDYIPSELVQNILPRLPVDDVIRCTSVCKSWYKLITSPSFASLHLSLSNQEPRLLVQFIKRVNSEIEYSEYDYRDRESKYFLHRDNQTFDEIAKLDPPIHPNWVTIDTLDGLFCLYDYRQPTIALWNPSIRKSIVLPKSTVLSRVLFDLLVVGFGFVTTSNDYKILMLLRAYNKRTVSRAEIYQLSTNSWHDVKLEDSLNFEVRYRQAHLNGVLHWYAYNKREANPSFINFICSFDLKNEKYGTLMVPSCFRLRHDRDMCFILHAFKESLYMIDYEHKHSCKIWVMKEYGVADSWQNLFVIDQKMCGLGTAYHFRANEEILFDKSSRCSFNSELLSYDCYSMRVKSNGLLTNSLVSSMHKYVESLALIKAPNEASRD